MTVDSVIRTTGQNFAIIEIIELSDSENCRHFGHIYKSTIMCLIFTVTVDVEFYIKDVFLVFTSNEKKLEIKFLFLTKLIPK